MVRRAFVLAFVFLNGCAPAHAHVELGHVEALPVRPVARVIHPHVRIEGNALVSRDRLIDVIEEDDPERDLSRLLAAYYDLGYLQAKIDEPVVENGTTTFRVHEGRRFRIGKIEALVTTPDGVPMRTYLHARSGEWFSRRVWVDDLAAMRALYHDAGHPMVEIPIQTDIDADDDVVDVRIADVHLGPRVTIDRVDVIAPSTEIASSARASCGVAPGDLFNASKLEAARQRLLATGTWTRVDMSYSIPLGSDADAPEAKATIRYELTP